MRKYVVTFGGLILALAFVAVFFVGRSNNRYLTDVAPKVGMSYDELMALGPRVASSTGVTLGTSRRVVYLLACSGLSSKSTLEAQATQAGSLARRQRLTDREAVGAVLTRAGAEEGTDPLKDC
jgi:hypothetical protein